MAQSEEKIICPICQHENPPGAKQCEKCKAPLPTITTVPVPEIAPQTVIDSTKTRDISVYKGELRGGALALHVAGQPQPIIIKGAQDEIVLGRRVLDEPPPTVDLSEYHAHLLGVSRRHAAIHKQDVQFTLEDLGSSNGTWLNENRLTPNQPQKLQHGDQIRLGQLIMFAYFTSIQSITLVEHGDTASLARRRITPHYMVEQIGPYLMAVEKLQTIVDELQGRPTTEVGMGSLVVGAEKSLNITLENAVEALHWVRTKITPWRKQHAEVISQLRQAAPPAQNGGSDQPPAPPDRQAFESNLAKELVEHIAPVLSPEVSQSSVQKLVPPLDTLLFSLLEITDEP